STAGRAKVWAYDRHWLSTASCSSAAHSITPSFIEIQVLRFRFESAEPYPLKLETFRLMCGSDSTRPKKWREQVGEACDELRENGLVESAWVNDDLVHCKR
ncbi:plasmid replication initiator TrfA, partial [Xylophilus ampelinus]